MAEGADTGLVTAVGRLGSAGDVSASAGPPGWTVLGLAVPVLLLRCEYPRVAWYRAKVPEEHGLPGEGFGMVSLLLIPEARLDLVHLYFSFLSL